MVKSSSRGYASGGGGGPGRGAAARGGDRIGPIERLSDALSDERGSTGMLGRGVLRARHRLLLQSEMQGDRALHTQVCSKAASVKLWRANANDGMHAFQLTQSNAGVQRRSLVAGPRQWRADRDAWWLPENKEAIRRAKEEAAIRRAKEEAAKVDRSPRRPPDLANKSFHPCGTPVWSPGEDIDWDAWDDPWDHPDADRIINHSSAMSEVAHMDRETKRQCKDKSSVVHG